MDEELKQEVGARIPNPADASMPNEKEYLGMRVKQQAKYFRRDKERYPKPKVKRRSKRKKLMKCHKLISNQTQLLINKYHSYD